MTCNPYGRASTMSPVGEQGSVVHSRMLVALCKGSRCHTGVRREGARASRAFVVAGMSLGNSVVSAPHNANLAKSLAGLQNSTKRLPLLPCVL